MRKTFSLINQNCRTAARLISDAHERELSRLERVGLGIHVMGCRSCRRYRTQVAMVDALVKANVSIQDMADTLPTERRLRISNRIRAALGEKPTSQE